MNGQLQRLSDTRWQYRRGKKTHYIRHVNSGSSEPPLFVVDDVAEQVRGEDIADVCGWIDEGMPMDTGSYSPTVSAVAAQSPTNAPQWMMVAICNNCGYRGSPTSSANGNFVCGACGDPFSTNAPTPAKLSFCPSCGGTAAYNPIIGCYECPCGIKFAP